MCTSARLGHGHQWQDDEDDEDGNEEHEEEDEDDYDDVGGGGVGRKGGNMRWMVGDQREVV